MKRASGHVSRGGGRRGARRLRRQQFGPRPSPRPPRPSTSCATGAPVAGIPRSPRASSSPACAIRSTSRRRRETASGSTSSSRAAASGSSATASCRRAVPRRLRADLERRRARPARPRLPPAVRDEPPLLRQLHGPARRHPRGRVPRDAPPTRRTRRSERVLLARPSPSPTTTAAASPSAPTDAATSGSATAAPAATRSATARGSTPPRQDPAHRRGRGDAVRGAGGQPLRSTAGARARDLGLRPAQPVPLLRRRPTGDL